MKRLIHGLLVGLLLLVQATANPRTGITDEQKQEILDAVSNILHTEAFVPNVDFNAWDNFIAKKSDEIQKADTNIEFARAVQDALTKFGVSHTLLITPEVIKAEETQSTIGIGILVGSDPDGLLVTKVYPSTPAEKAGIKAGDVILEVDGHKVDTVTAVRGPEGSRAEMRIKRPSGEKVNLSIVRTVYSIAEPTTFKAIDKNTAYLRLPSFHTSYDRRQVEGFMTKAASYKNLILDLRSNPGGEISNWRHFMNLLLPPKTFVGCFVGPIEVTRYRGTHGGQLDLTKIVESVPAERQDRAAPGRVPYYKGNIAVLINHSSGSASEMAAAALHDLVGATLVGSHTAGAVLISIVKDLPDGFRLQYPIFDYITSNRKRLEGTGVEPDISVKEPRLIGVDPDEPLIKAKALLERLSRLRASRWPSAAALRLAYAS